MLHDGVLKHHSETLYGKYSCDKIKQYLELRNFPEMQKATMELLIKNAKRFYADQHGFTNSVVKVLDIE